MTISESLGKHERVQARISLPRELATVIDAARLRWNPEVATNNPAHLTVIYHDEAPDTQLLCSRLEAIVSTLSPFNLTLRRPKRFEAPDSGAFIEVSDPSRRLIQLRETLLLPPFTMRSRFGLHVTLIHPSYGFRLDEAWESLQELGDAGSFIAKQIDLVAGKGAETRTIASFPLE